MFVGLNKRLQKSPRIHRFAYACYVHSRTLLDLPRYLACRLTNRVYLGPVMLGRQTWGTRVPHMRRLITEQVSRTKGGAFDVLEIGSWAGQSAMLWGDELRRSARPGKVFCIDTWKPFASPQQISGSAGIASMDRAARRDKIFSLFWHNVMASGLDDLIVPLRGRSTDILPILRPRSFDLVFVDASHAYTDFVADLKLSAPLVKVGGLICGDDLEYQSGDVDRRVAERDRELDFILDAARGQQYHPGITMGILDFFGRGISCYDGFWVQRRTEEGWEDVGL